MYMKKEELILKDRLKKLFATGALIEKQGIKLNAKNTRLAEAATKFNKKVMAFVANYPDNVKKIKTMHIYDQFHIFQNIHIQMEEIKKGMLLKKKNDKREIKIVQKAADEISLLKKFVATDMATTTTILKKMKKAETILERQLELYNQLNNHFDDMINKIKIVLQSIDEVMD